MKPSHSYHTAGIIAVVIFTALLALSCFGCHTIKKTVSTHSDTTVNARTVDVPFDTTVRIKGSTSLIIDTVIVVNGMADFPERTVTVAGIKTTYGIRAGKLSIKTQTPDSSVAVKGHAKAQVFDTRVNTTKTVTIVEKPSWFGNLWQHVKDYFLVIVILIVVLLLLLFRTAIKRMFSA